MIFKGDTSQNQNFAYILVTPIVAYENCTTARGGHRWPLFYKSVISAIRRTEYGNLVNSKMFGDGISHFRLKLIKCRLYKDFGSNRIKSLLAVLRYRSFWRNRVIFYCSAQWSNSITTPKKVQQTFLIFYGDHI